jgi:hypothetical protein
MTTHQEGVYKKKSSHKINAEICSWSVTQGNSKAEEWISSPGQY